MVISNCAPADETGKMRLSRAGAIEGPTRDSPISPEIAADVETGPIVDCRCRGLVNRCFRDHWPQRFRIGDKLIAKAAIEAPALKVVSSSIVPPQIAEPARVHHLRRDAEAKFAIGPLAAGGDRGAESRKGGTYSRKIAR